MKTTLYLALLFLVACSSPEPETLMFETLDTDFSKGRLTHRQTITLHDLEKFHGHLCDGLVVGALAMQQAMEMLYPSQPIDRTNLRIVSKPSPCLTDVAIYLSGGRYQFNTFYVDTAFDGLYLVQRIDDQKTVAVALRPGVKPPQIDSLGNLAIQQTLAPCDLDQLQRLEDDFTARLLAADPTKLFTVRLLDTFNWEPSTKHDYLKTDILNKYKPSCH